MRFGFSLNPIARLRGASLSGQPDPAYFGALAQAAGADLILAGYLPGSGFLTERDLRLLRDLIRIDLVLIVPLQNLIVEAVAKLRPEGVILVDAGWDGVRDSRPLQPDVEADEIASIAAAYKSAGVPVSLFLEPLPGAAKFAARTGASGITFSTSAYAATRADEEASRALDQIGAASMATGRFGLIVSAGRGLTIHNVRSLAAVRNIDEIYVGQALASRAMQIGLDGAVREMIAVLHRSRTEG
ncbi:MAG: pyridoxine 5'-phosphate synthase [Calditrichaeota bacterium]|nr:pyridoxine 5'-phosphate synthase [Calditrichota bacterium]